MKSLTIRATLLSASALIVLAAPALAQDEEGLPPIEASLRNGATVTLYGQINKGILQYDDGAETQSYGLIDNDNSGTRFGLTYEQDFGAWSFENVNEFAYTTFSSSNANVLNTSPNADDYEFTNANIRKIDFTLAHDGYGKFWLGQGSMATDGIAEMDLSGTDVIAYSGVGDSAGGQFLRQSDGELADFVIGDVYANYDGDRRVRARYDTREFSGFTFAAAYGRNLLSDDSDTREQDLADASLTYENTFSEVFEVVAGVGYYWQQDDAKIFAGSASGLHTPTGVNLTFAAGNQDFDDAGHGTFWYGKLGILRDVISWGATGLSVDYYTGSDLYLDEEAGITGSDSDSWGVGFVQNIDRANTQLWLTYRSYDYADNAASYDDGAALFGGARFSF